MATETPAPNSAPTTENAPSVAAPVAVEGVAQADVPTAVTTPAVAPATPPPAAEAKPVDTKASAFAELARKKRDLRQREDKLKADGEAAEKWRAIEAAKKAGDHAAILRLTGVDLDAAARGTEAPDPLAQAQARLDKIEADTQAARAERDEAARDASIAQGIAYIAKEIETKADVFPLVHELGQSQKVFKLMADMLHVHQTEVSWEEAAAEVEADLAADMEAGVVRAQQRRAKAKGVGAAGEPQERSEEPRAAQTAQSPTITSRMNGEAATGSPKPFDFEAHRRGVLREFSSQ